MFSERFIVNLLDNGELICEVWRVQYDNTLNEPRAINYRKLHEPERPDLFDEMLHSLLGAPSQEQFENFTLLYILDTKYPRSDISFACGIVSREKGWKQG